MTKFQPAKGMTLLEVVIAMTIIALCVPAILLGVNVIRIQMEKNLALTRAKGIIAAEKQRIDERTFSELDSANLISITVKNAYTPKVIPNVFHAFSDTRSERTEYFAAYKASPLEVTLKDKSKFYLDPVYGDRIKVYRITPSPYVETELRKDIQWTLDIGNYQNISLGAGIVKGDTIKVTYLPSTGPTEIYAEECSLVSDDSHKKSKVVLENLVYELINTTVSGGFVRIEKVLFPAASPPISSVVLAKEVNTTCSSFPINPGYVRGGYVGFPQSDIPYTLEADNKTITFIPPFPLSAPAPPEATDYEFEVQYLSVAEIPPSGKWIIDARDNRSIIFSAEQPEIDPVSPEDWPYHMHVNYIPNEIGGPPLTDTTVITQVESGALTLKKITITVYPKDKLDAAPITQSVFFKR